ncbi:MAG: type II secretion system F family protein [Solirubrobacteraceae bacterium]|jgi:tight adherence protein C
MVILLFAIGIGMVAVSGRLLARAIVVPRLHLKQHLREIRDYGFDRPIDLDPISPSERLKRAFKSSARATGAFAMRRLPSVSALSPSELGAAGFYDVSPEIVHGYRVFAAIGLPGALLALMLASGKLSGLEILLLLVSAAAGWILPSFLVRKRGGSRMEEVDRRLPELIDLLISTVEAGMGFTASMALVADRFDGALGAELKLTMKRQSLGMTVPQALDEMVERCDTAAVRAFVRTAGRGESLGVSIGPVLRELSADQRRRHRMAARERMQKAPIKMIFPLIFLIFPALMIVLLYPAAWSVTHNLGGVF